MAVQLHALLVGIIHTGSGKVCDLLNTHHGTDSQLVIETVQGRHTFEFYKIARRNLTPQLFQLLISGKHFYMDGIGKVRYCQGNNGALPADLPLLHIEDFAANGYLSHLLDDLLQRNRLIFKITSIKHIRVITSPDTAAAAFSAEPSAAKRFRCIFTGTGCCRSGTISR